MALILIFFSPCGCPVFIKLPENLVSMAPEGFTDGLIGLTELPAGRSTICIYYTWLCCAANAKS